MSKPNYTCEICGDAFHDPSKTVCSKCLPMARKQSELVAKSYNPKTYEDKK